MRIVIAMALVALLAAAPAAQVIGADNVTVLSTGACNAGACAVFQVGDAPTVTLQVSGTFTGTLTFETTSDGTTWLTVALIELSDGTIETTTTDGGQFALLNVGVLQVRARATAWASGMAHVTATRGRATALLVAP